MMTAAESPFSIAVASGKGGTGKTTVAVNLAISISEVSQPVTYMDCDVEEPNGHIFLKSVWDRTSDVTVPIPRVDQETCIHCGKCGRICQFSAIIDMGTEVLTFDDLCHSCGGCALVCPVGAIIEENKPIGEISTGRSGAVQVIQGKLNVGHPVSPPVIRAVKAGAGSAGMHIIDCPPGTSCPVIESVKDADFVILVTEPTPFGLSDLKMAVDMLDMMHKKTGLVINRAGTGDQEVYQYCRERDLPILLEIEDNRKIAEAYSRGELAITVSPELRARFIQLTEDIQRRVRS